MSGGKWQRQLQPTSCQTVSLPHTWAGLYLAVHDGMFAVHDDFAGCRDHKGRHHGRRLLAAQRRRASCCGCLGDGHGDCQWCGHRAGGRLLRHLSRVGRHIIWVVVKAVCTQSQLAAVPFNSADATRRGLTWRVQCVSLDANVRWHVQIQGAVRRDGTRMQHRRRQEAVYSSIGDNVIVHGLSQRLPTLRSSRAQPAMQEPT